MIYFMQADESGPVKIGWSKNPVARSHQVRPTPETVLTIIRLIDGPDWGERWLHQYFAERRLSGEWFTFDPEMLEVELPAVKPWPDAPEDTVNVRFDRELWEVIWARSRHTKRSASAELSFVVREALLGRLPPEVPGASLMAAIERGFARPDPSP